MKEEELNTFPESVRDWDEIKNSESSEVAWDRLANIRSKMGTALFKPGEDAGEEGKKKFIDQVVEISGGELMPRPDMEDEEHRKATYKALGCPDDPSEYEFAEIEGSEYPKERKEFLSSLAHELGLSKSQLKTLDQKIRTQELDGVIEAKKAHDTALSDLKQDWGLTFDDRVHQAKKIAETFFPGLPEDTVFTASELKSFHAIAKQLGTNTREFNDQQGGSGQDLNSPNEARDKINEIRANPDHPYFDQTKPGHTAARARMRELYKEANSIQ